MKLAALAVCETVLYLLLKRYKPELCPLCEISAAVAVFFMLVPEIKQLKSLIAELMGTAGVSGEYMTVIVKVVGLAVITDFSADMCRDSGQNALGTKIEFFGTVSVLIAAVPVFKALLQLIVSAAGV